MGSQTHVTEAPEAVTFSTIVGSASRIRPAPIRVMKVRRPGSRSGSTLSMIRRRSSVSASAETLTPTGLRTEATKSMWAPSRWRVRSPTQTKCPDVT